MDRVADPVVSRFQNELLPRLRELYQPDAVLVFGSRARGDALEDSDLDLLIVSARFRGVPFLDRAVAVLLDLAPPFAVDVLCYTPEEFDAKQGDLGIVGLAAEEGLWL